MNKIMELATAAGILEDKRERMERAHRAEEQAMRLRHAVDRLAGEVLAGHWCRQAYELRGMTYETDVWVVGGRRFALLALFDDKATLRAWSWNDEEDCMHWSGPLAKLSDLLSLQFDPPAEQEDAA